MECIMKLRCVLGPRDGWYWEILEHYKDINIPAPAKNKMVLLPLDKAGTVHPTTEITRYTRRLLRQLDSEGHVDEFQFLAPDGISDMEALRHQFSK